MKNLLILLLALPLYAQESRQSITNQLIKPNTPPHNLPYIKFEEIYKLRTPVPDMDVNNRLVQVQDNFKWLMEAVFPGPFNYTVLPNDGQDKLIKQYFEIYLDPVTSEYYQGLFYPIPEVARPKVKLPNFSPMDIGNSRRFVYITNLEPSVRVYMDTANRGAVWCQKLTKIPDLHKGYSGMGLYLYPDPENQIKVKISPRTNQTTGIVYYEGVNPRTKQKFYAGRTWRYDGDLQKELMGNYGYPEGYLSWIEDNAKDVIETIQFKQTPVFND